MRYIAEICKDLQDAVDVGSDKGEYCISREEWEGMLLDGQMDFEDLMTELVRSYFDIYRFGVKSEFGIMVVSWKRKDLNAKEKENERRHNDHRGEEEHDLDDVPLREQVESAGRP